MLAGEDMRPQHKKCLQLHLLRILWSSEKALCQDIQLILAWAEHQINCALTSYRSDIRAQVQAFEEGLTAIQRIKALLSSACEQHSAIFWGMIIYSLYDKYKENGQNTIIWTQIVQKESLN